MFKKTFKALSAFVIAMVISTVALAGTNSSNVFNFLNGDIVGDATNNISNFDDISANTFTGDGSGLTNVSGMAIGGTVTGSSDEAVLFINGTSLAQDSDIEYSDTINQLRVGQTFGTTQANAIYSAKLFARGTSTSASLGTSSLEYDIGADTGILRTTKETGPAATFDDFEIRLTDATFGNHRIPFFADGTNERVGIFETSPAGKLTVTNTLNTQPTLAINAPASGNAINVNSGQFTVDDNGLTTVNEQVFITTPDGSGNATLELDQADVTNNPDVINITNNGTGNDITGSNWSVNSDGSFDTLGDFQFGAGSAVNFAFATGNAVLYTDGSSDVLGDEALFSFDDTNNNVGIGVASADASALLELNSTTQGLLPSRGTQTQRDAIVSPATGLHFYNTTKGTYDSYNGTSWTSTARTNHVLVKSADDLPTAVAGVRTLLADTIYEIDGAIDLGTDRLVMADDVILKGDNRTEDSITSAVVGSLITATDVSFIIDGLSLSATAGTILTASNPGLNHFLEVTQSQLENSDDVADIDGYGVVFLDKNIVRLNDDGVKINGTSTALFDVNLFNLFNGVAGSNFIEVDGGTVGILSIEGGIYNPETNETAIDIDATATVANLLINGNNFVGEGAGGTYLDAAIDTDNSNYTIVGNRGLSDFSDNTAIGSMLMENNATNTVIAVSGTWTKVAGTTVAGSNIHRFTMTTDNELTADIARDISKTVFVSVDSERIGAGTDDFEFTVFQNGSKVANVTAFMENNAQAKSLSFNAPVTVSNGDTFEIFVRNQTDTDDILIRNMQVSIQ